MGHLRVPHDAGRAVRRHPVHHDLQLQHLHVLQLFLPRQERHRHNATGLPHPGTALGIYRGEGTQKTVHQGSDSLRRGRWRNETTAIGCKLLLENANNVEGFVIVRYK